MGLSPYALRMGICNLFDRHLLPAGVGAWMSTRAGGHSAAPWDSFNLGDHVGDAPDHVQANRQLLADTLGVRPVFLRQVHGTDAIELDPGTPDGAVADACFTFEHGLACTIMVADCLPVLFWDAQGRWVAAAHAGWRGLAGQEGVGVLESLWVNLNARGATPAQTRVWLGPCIGPAAFEVGPEVRRVFVTQQPEVASAFRPGRGDRWLADLPALARSRLRRMGLVEVLGNDGSPDWCTASRPVPFFSHRRDAVLLGSTGRMAACIWRSPKNQ
jgi:polyphenol oxidase